MIASEDRSIGQEIAIAVAIAGLSVIAEGLARIVVDELRERATGRERRANDEIEPVKVVVKR